VGRRNYDLGEEGRGRKIKSSSTPTILLFYLCEARKKQIKAEKGKKIHFQFLGGGGGQGGEGEIFPKRRKKKEGQSPFLKLLMAGRGGVVRMSMEGGGREVKSLRASFSPPPVQGEKGGEKRSPKKVGKSSLISESLPSSSRKKGRMGGLKAKERKNVNLSILTEKKQPSPRWEAEEKGAKGCGRWKEKIALIH